MLLISCLKIRTLKYNGTNREKGRKDEIRLESNMDDDKCECLSVHFSEFQLFADLKQTNFFNISISSLRQTSAYVGCFSDVSSEKTP